MAGSTIRKHIFTGLEMITISQKEVLSEKNQFQPPTNHNHWLKSVSKSILYVSIGQLYERIL